MGRADDDARPDRRLPGPRGRSRRAQPRPWPPAARRAAGRSACGTEVDRHRGRRRPRGRRTHRGRRAAAGPPRGRRRRRRPAPVRRPAGRRATSRRGPGGRCARFQLDPATVKVDWALSGPVPVGVAPAVRTRAPCTSRTRSSEMTEALGQVAAGAVPGAAVPAGRPDDHQRPDPVAGRHRVALGLHPRPAGRAGATPATAAMRGAWDHDDCERFADRMQARLERLAPGFGVPGAGPPRARPARARGARRQPDRRRPQRRHRAAAPAAGLPAGPRAGPGRDAGSAGCTSGSASAHPGGGVHGAAGRTPPAPRCSMPGYAGSCPGAESSGLSLRGPRWCAR